jgi:hypothetical protein
LPGNGRNDCATSRLAPLVVPNSVARPAYDLSAVTPGIVHIGLGAFIAATSRNTPTT